MQVTQALIVCDDLTDLEIVVEPQALTLPTPARMVSCYEVNSRDCIKDGELSDKAPLVLISMNVSGILTTVMPAMRCVQTQKNSFDCVCNSLASRFFYNVYVHVYQYYF